VKADESAKELVERADKLMYEYKTKGQIRNEAE